MMEKTLKIDEEVHRRLDVWRAERGLRTFSDAVKDLLDEAAQKAARSFEK